MSPSMPEPPPEGPDTSQALGSGAIATLVRSGEWHAELGPEASWPEELRSTMAVALASPLPMLIAWGPSSRLLYNDAFRDRLGPRRHPAALGGPIAEFLPEVSAALGPAFDRVRNGDSVALLTSYLPLARDGDFENRWFAVSAGPIRAADASVGGVLAVLMETTDFVDAERRLSTIRELALQTAEARTPAEACTSAASVLWMNPVDVPFGTVYLVDEDAGEAVRTCLIGLSRDHPSSPPTISLSAGDAERTWPIARIIRTGKAELLTDLAQHLDPLPGRPYPEPAGAALLVPLRIPGVERPYGVLVAGVSPRRSLDRSYREFIDLAARQLAGAICHARGIQHAHAASGERPLRHRNAAASPAEVEDLKHDLSEALALARATRHDSDATQRAKDEFLALLGHELRDPLAPMTIVLKLMKQEAGAEDMFPKERGILERQLARLSELVDDLRDVSRMTRGGIVLERKRVSLSTVLARAMAMGAPFLERHMHQLDVSIAATGGIEIDADEARLAQALAGLVTSAVRHARAGSRIVVEARTEAGQVVLAIRELASPGGADSEGPTAEPVPRQPRAIGVGFPILRNIIVLHGGSVIPTEDGATGGFEVRLPLASSGDETSRSEGAPTIPTPKEPENEA